MKKLAQKWNTFPLLLWAAQKAQTIEFMLSSVAYKSHFWQKMVQDNYSLISISATFGL